MVLTIEYGCRLLMALLSTLKTTTADNADNLADVGGLD